MHGSRRKWIVAVALVALLGVFASGSSAASSKSAPVNNTAPTITGTAVVGATLTGSPGGWTGWGTRFSYVWLRCDNGGGNCAPIDGATGTTDTLVSADVGSTLRFSVVAASRRGSTSATSNATAVVTQPASGATPSPPTGLTATGPTTTSIALSWTASADGNDPAAGYNVYVNGALASSTAGTSASVGSLGCGTSYTFAVEAYDAAGNKSDQDSISASTSDCPLSPSAPTGLAAGSPTTNSIGLTWNASSGGTDPTAGYHVYVNGTLVSSTAGTSASVGSLDCGTSYSFAVDAYDAFGNKSAQDSTSASTSDCPSSNSPIYWGAWIDGTDTYSSLYGGSWGNAPWDSNTWNKYQSNSGKAPSIVHWGVGTPWDHSFSYWAGTLNLVQNRGALNLLDIDTGSVSLSSIASGSEDSAIKTWAQQAAAYGHPFFLRLDWEMNAGWFSWGTTSSNQNTPADYVAAWRHIHDLFTAAGASNVTWVWCPNVEGSSSTPYSKLYPGDAYVDWTCLDGYNQDSTSTSFSNIYGKSYTDLTALAPSKPVMVGEVGSYEYGSGDKGRWITGMLNALPTSFPQIKALVWFNWRIHEGGIWKNWEIESSASSQSAWSTGIAAPYYAAASSFAMPASLKPIQPLH